MIQKSASPTPFPTVDEQLRLLYQRRCLIARLITDLEEYQRLTPQEYTKKPRVA
jgi:hypothetical protein